MLSFELTNQITTPRYIKAMAKLTCKMNQSLISSIWSRFSFLDVMASSNSTTRSKVLFFLLGGA